MEKKDCRKNERPGFSLEETRSKGRVFYGYTLIGMGLSGISVSVHFSVLTIL